jgi:hypothetical protein
LLGKDLDESLYEDFETFIINKVEAGHDPVICAMIMLSLGLGICKTSLDNKTQEEILAMIRAYVKSEEKLDNSITYH